MTTSVATQRTQALRPVRTRLIERARDDAGTVVAAARAEAAKIIAEAEQQARSILDEARARGEAEAAAQTAALRMSARREARDVELAAERAIYDALCAGVERGVCALRDAPQYPAMLAELERRARDVLGPGAEIVQHTRGGVVGSAPGRRADLSLPAIAARAIGELGGEAARLWTA